MPEETKMKVCDAAAIILAAAFVWTPLAVSPTEKLIQQYWNAAAAHKAVQCCQSSFGVTYGPIILSALTFGVLVWQAFIYSNQTRILERQTHANIASQRAFVNFVGVHCQRSIHSKTGEPTFLVMPKWENSGQTPTKDLIAHANWSDKTIIAPIGPDFSLHNRGDTAPRSMVLSPKNVLTGLAAELTMQDLCDIQEKRRFFYVWGDARYRDIFPGSPLHVTEYAMQLSEIRGDPNTIGPTPDPAKKIYLIWTNLDRHNRAYDEPNSHHGAKQS